MANMLRDTFCAREHTLGTKRGRKREKGRDYRRGGIEKEREIHVGLNKLYQQDWSLPTGVLCPAWLRS